jgi:hypothetical protein
MKLIYFFIIVAFFRLNSTFAGPAVTYEFSGGRFGDNLVSYLHAKWISYYYQIPLLYIPFPYSSELKMADHEYKNHQLQPFLNQERIYSFDQPSNVHSSTLFFCPYFPEVASELKSGQFIHFPVDWKNQEFRKIVNEMISPRHNLQLTHPPDGVVSIAIHVREGGGYDHPNHHIWDPEKIPPVSFYIESLLNVLELFTSKTLHCHLFTDAKNPKTILETIQRSVPSKTHITFSCRENCNLHDANVLEDFFSLFNFDILIRPQSNFSIVPARIHDFAIVCSPITFSVHDQIIKIEHIEMEVNHELLKKCLEK